MLTVPHSALWIANFRGVSERRSRRANIGKIRIESQSLSAAGWRKKLTFKEIVYLFSFLPNILSIP